ncbi:MAG: hypothetical protein HXS43_13345 [Theionarchaea archaeon]|nr:hypothetical protein [Theionarchaea archaeon]
MKKDYYLIVTITMLLLCLCIGQEEEWTVDDWKDHLMFVSPSGTQGGIPGFVPTSSTVMTLPVGTHMVFDVVSEGTVGELEMPTRMVLGLRYLGTERVNEKECAALQITMNMEIEMYGESMAMASEGKEWIGEDGAPVKMDFRATGNLAGIEIPISLTGGLTEETQYQGHECWVFTVTQKVEMAGPSTEMEMIMYMDKESRALVRIVAKMGEIEQDSGYMEPVFSIGPSTWELGPEETVTTPLGTYKCQVIYVVEEGKTVGTIWATKDVRAPVKYIYTFENGDSNLEVTMVLIEYSSG